MNGAPNKRRWLWATLLTALIAAGALLYPRTPLYSVELTAVNTKFLNYVSEGDYQAGLRFVFDKKSDPDHEDVTRLSILAKDEYEDFIQSDELSLFKRLNKVESVAVENLVFASDRWYGRTVTTFSYGGGMEHKITAAWIRTPKGEWKLTDI